MQVLFVLDVSRSMAASAHLRSPTRLDRAAAAAERLRTAVPTVPAGIAGLTDRVLPNLLPVADAAGFARVRRPGRLDREPAAAGDAVRATAYDALEQIPGAGFFDPRARSRIVVVLTDGESTPVQTGEVAAAFAAQPGYHVLFVRFWRSGEAIFDADGRVESAYRPDPAGGAVLDNLASALGGSAYGEDALGSAEQRLRQLAGDGPATVLPGTVRTETPLAPFSAGLAIVVAAALAALAGFGRRVRWTLS